MTGEEPSGISVVVERVDRPGRLLDGLFLVLALSWLTYTALYFYLHPKGLTFDPSLFMYLTGKPDPACGFTRTFASMWRGDVVGAARVYPLGPLLFVALILGTVNSAASVAAGTAIRIEMSQRSARIGLLILVAAFAANWASKLIWLGM